MAGLYSDYWRQNILENSKRSRMFRRLDEKGNRKCERNGKKADQVSSRTMLL